MTLDYDLVNYCANCCIKFPKDQKRCTDCHWQIRTKPVKTSEDVHRY